MCRNYTDCWCFHFPRTPLHSIVKSKPRAKWIKRRGMRSNASHLTLVCPFALTPPPPCSPGHSWAAPTGALSVTCQTNRAARFSELCWDLEVESLSCLPRHKQPRSGVGGKNDMKPGVADPWFHEQFTESWVSGQLVNSSLPQRAPAWARIHDRPLQVQHMRQIWSKNRHPAVISRQRTCLLFVFACSWKTKYPRHEIHTQRATPGVNEEEFQFVFCGCFLHKSDQINFSVESLWFACSTSYCISCTGDSHWSRSWLGLKL